MSSRVACCLYITLVGEVGGERTEHEGECGRLLHSRATAASMAAARAALSVYHLPTHPRPVVCARPATALAPQHSGRVHLASATHATVAQLGSGRGALHTRRSTPASQPSSRGVLRVTVRTPDASAGNRDTPQGWILRAVQHSGWCLEQPPHLCTPLTLVSDDRTPKP